MRFYLLLVLVPAAAFAAASLACAALVAGTWPRMTRWLGRLAADGRARTIACLRLLPSIAGLVSGAALLAVFLRFEPRDTDEAVGLLLLGFAAVAGLLCLRSLTRLVIAGQVMRQCSRLLRTCACEVRRSDGSTLWIVDTRYPVAAVMGVFRTRLLLSARIMEECTESEVESVIRHEAAHVRRRDNLIQAGIRFLPDPLAFSDAGRAMQEAWAAAAEEAADNEAAGSDIEARTELASALVRVSRMADGPPPRWMPALAFFQGANLDVRVHRLLTEARVPTRGLAPSGVALAVLAVCAGALTETIGLRIHGLMELAVQLLP